jgi:hypothetical protein
MFLLCVYRYVGKYVRFGRGFTLADVILGKVLEINQWNLKENAVKSEEKEVQVSIEEITPPIYQWMVCGEKYERRKEKMWEKGMREEGYSENLK